MRVARIQEIEPITVAGVNWRPLRRTLGIEAFGINAYTADTGEHVVEEHDETGAGAGHHEELYVVLTGRATFTVDGKEIDAPAGTCVFLEAPKARRGARAAADGTTVLAIGGERGAAYRVSPGEFVFAGAPAFNAKRYDEFKQLVLEGLEQYPGNTALLYDLACAEALSGDKESALEHLTQAVANPRMRKAAAGESDFDSLRDDPRFSAALESPQG